MLTLYRAVHLLIICLYAQIAMEKVPDHILEPMWKDEPNQKPSQWH